MPNIQFDVEGARKSGYSDTEIADIISSKSGFDAASARKAGYGDADIITRLTAPPAPTPAEQARTALAEDQGIGKSMLIGAGRTFDRLGKGTQQLYYGATGDKKAQAELKTRAEDDDQMYKSLQNVHPVATAVGESLPAMAVPVGATATVLGTAAKIGGAAAVQAGAEYGSASERAKRAALAGAGAVVGGVVVPKAVGAVVEGSKAALKGLAGNITPQALALAARAKELGIPVNAAQLGDSKFLKTLASSLEQMPFTGGAKSAAAQRTAFTNAVGKTFGEDADKLTPEVYAAAKARLGTQFNELAARNNLDVTPALKTKLAGIAAEAEGTAADDTKRAVANIIGRTTEQAETKGGAVPAQMSSVLGADGQPFVKVAASSTPATTKLPGATYSSIDSELSNIIKAGGEKGLYAKRMQEAIRNAMDDSISPADQALWTETRTQYKNLKAVRNTVAKDMGNGDVPPSQLMNALTSTDAGKEAMAMGKRGALGEIGQIGKQFVRDSVPNSGTAQRAMAMGLIGGGGYAFGADPTTIAGMMVGGATAGRMINKVLNSPKTIEALGKQGLTIGELAKLPPDRVYQILGGITGMSTAELAGN